jgi:hypothetical protein
MQIHRVHNLAIHSAAVMNSELSCIGEIERRLLKSKINLPLAHGAIAQLGERIVRNDEVVGSIPTSSTNLSNKLEGAFQHKKPFISAHGPGRENR